MKRLPKLDARLQEAADSIPEGCRLAADIGADHGRLSCWLLASGRCRDMLITDISDAALSKARRLLALHDLSDRARFVVADGFNAIAEPVDAVVVCGLGSKTIAGMLKQADRLQGARLILSANTQLPLLRSALMDAGYRLISETIVQAAGRYYSIMVAEPGCMQLTPRELYIGTALRGSDSVSLQAYFAWRLEVASARRGTKQQAQEIEWLKEEIAHAKGQQPDHL